MDADDYFIRILKLFDSLGNQWGIENLDNTLLIAKGILRVNDQIEIFIEAYDPKNRVITFEFGSGQSYKSQDNGKFELTVTKQMIGRPSYFWVKVHTKDSDYENILRKDLLYTVLP
jgi:hypothetical protein